MLGFLGRALSLELTAVQQYKTSARLLKLRGFEDLSVKCERESKTEIEHVERIIERMLVLGSAPSASRLRPVALGGSVPELIASIERLEKEVAEFYRQASDYCRKIDDYDNHLFFHRLMQDEVKHADSLNTVQPGAVAEFTAAEKRRGAEQ